MTASLGISTAGNFVTGDYMSTVAAGLGPQSAGVTDIDLFDKYNASVINGLGDENRFLDSLSSSQLDEVTIGNFSEGPRVTTYGDIKLYQQLTDDLGDQISALTSGSTLAVNSYTSSNVDSSQAQALKAIDLFDNLEDNKPGSITAAEKYLSSSGDSNAASSAAAPASTPSGIGSGRSEHTEETAGQLSSADIEELFKQEGSDNAYMLNNPYGDWAASSASKVVDSAASNELLATADKLNTET